jgi:hypothetical protein
VDDSCAGARAAGTAGRGTTRQPLIAAVDRAPAGRGSCVVRCVEDRGGGSYRQFGHDHLCHASRIRADAWAGAAVGLSDFAGLAQRPFGKDDWDSSLPMVHRVISNFKAFVEGTFHGLSASHMQPYADELGWRPDHRATRDAAADLLRDMCLGHVPLGGIAATATTQPKMVQ